MNKNTVSGAFRSFAFCVLLTMTAHAMAESTAVFDDAVESHWQLSGWTGTQTVQGQFVKSGTAAVKTVADTWGGLSFDSRDANWAWTDQPADRYTTLSFDISAGATVGATMSSIKVGLDVGYGLDAQISTYVSSFAPGVWYHVSIPLAAVNPNHLPFRKIAFQNNSESTLTFYIDNVVLASGASGASGALSSCAKIMPLGDSITAGTNGNYRQTLYTGLQADNCGVSFVGSQQDQAGLQHEGHGGWTIGNVAGSVNAWLNAAQPDIVLLMIGTNDVAWWTNDPATVHGSNHDALITQIQQAQAQQGRPDAWIFVASIPKVTSKEIHLLSSGPDTCYYDNEEHTPYACTMGERAVLVQEFNAKIEHNVQLRAQAGQHVRYVDVYSALTVQQLNQSVDDGVHPVDQSAYDAIANKFLAAIRAELGGANPPSPPAGGFTVNVNTAASRTPISPYIYGVNHQDPTMRNIGAVRHGGNRFAAYNWENNYSNAGGDHIDSNDTYLSDVYNVNGAQAGAVARAGVERAHDVGAAALITIPIGNWVAADAAGQIYEPASPSNPHFLPNAPRKPSARTYPPDLNDGAVYQDEFVSYIENQFAVARAQGKEIFYSLDNEPDLWREKHPLLRDGCWNAGCPDPKAASYVEIVTRATQYGKMIKDVAPAALTFGPVSYGYSGFSWFQGGTRDPAYNPPPGTDPEERNLDFLAYYLKKMGEAQAADGRRLLDVLDVHWYSEARSVPSNPNDPEDDGVRVVMDGASDIATPQLVEARVQAPRSLWDPSYIERSWIARDILQGPIRLIPRLKKIIADNYPGTKIAFTEYNHGAGNHISDAVAQADTLGIFAREGVHAAMFWTETGDTDAYTNAAIRMFRDYNGAGGMVGDVSVAATTPDIAKVAVYGLAHSGDNNIVEAIIVNRQTTAQSLTVQLAHSVPLSRVDVYQLDASNPAPFLPRFAGQATVSQNQYAYTAPALSVTTLVFRL